jgi:hypothetical protein
MPQRSAVAHKCSRRFFDSQYHSSAVLPQHLASGIVSFLLSLVSFGASIPTSSSVLHLTTYPTVSYSLNTIPRRYTHITCLAPTPHPTPSPPRILAPALRSTTSAFETVPRSRRSSALSCDGGPRPRHSCIPCLILLCADRSAAPLPLPFVQYTYLAVRQFAISSPHGREPVLCQDRSRAAIVVLKRVVGIYDAAVGNSVRVV